MYKNIPLTAQQIAELRGEVTKVLETSMETFATKASRLPELHLRDFDALYGFSQNEHIRTQKTLQSLADFAFTVLSNADLIWEEVQHRESKLLQLRESLSSATNYMEQLRAENDEMRSRLQEAETYIQWVEEEKEYLDAIYYDRSNLTVSTGDRPIHRCVSERNLHWHSQSKKKSPNYEKLKGYIEGLKEERAEMERELVLFAKKYEGKCEELRKANALVQHLVDRLNKKNERKDFLEALSSSQAREPRNDLNDDLLRALEKTDNQNTTGSLRQNTSLFEEETFLPQRQLHYFDSFTHLHERQEDHKQTKDVSIGTDSFGRKAAACQTHDAEQAKAGDLRISICVGGEGAVQQEQIVKIISELHIDKEIENRLRGGKSEQSQEKTAETSGKMSGLNRTLLSTYEYYHKRLVASRIKKYHFSKPDPAPTAPRRKPN